MLELALNGPEISGSCFAGEVLIGKVAMEQLSLKLSPREIKGKKVKRLRRDGIVPVHMYGTKTEPLSLQVEARVLRRVLIRAGANIPIDVEVEGQKGNSICFAREVQRHPVTEELLHADFLRVDATQTVTAEVPLILQGEAPAVREMGGTLIQPFSTIPVEALPMDMPAGIYVDVSHLDDFEKSVRVGELEVQEGATILRDADEMVARVLQPRIEEEEVVEEVEEGEEGVEAEGDEPAPKGRESEERED